MLLTNKRPLFRDIRQTRFARTSFYRGGIYRLFRFVLLLGLSFIIFYPLLTKVSSAFMSQSDVMDSTVWFIPRHPTMQNFLLVLQYGKFWKAMGSTFVISLVSATLQTVVCAMVGYGFAKFPFRGSRALFAILILTIIIPPQTIYISLYMKFRFFDVFGILSLLGLPTLRLVESLWPMVILSATGLGLKNGLFIFLMRQFYRGVPKELNEAALVDGSGPVRCYYRIMMPLSVPMMLSVFLLAFAWQWTDTFYSGLFYRDTPVLPNILKTVTQISAAGIQANTLMSSVMINTAALMIILPLLILYLFAQRFLIGGIERSGIVG